MLCKKLLTDRNTTVKQPGPRASHAQLQHTLHWRSCRRMCMAGRQKGLILTRALLAAGV